MKDADTTMVGEAAAQIYVPLTQDQLRAAGEVNVLTVELEKKTDS